jgi:hypothetical protein
MAKKGIYPNMIILYIGDYEYNWILKQMQELNISKSEAIRRALYLSASSDPDYIRPDKKGVM